MGRAALSTGAVAASAAGAAGQLWGCGCPRSLALCALCLAGAGTNMENHLGAHPWESSLAPGQSQGTLTISAGFPAQIVSPHNWADIKCLHAGL